MPKPRLLSWSIIALLGPFLLAFAEPAAAQERPLCRGTVFSIEEEFRSQGPRPFDGNPIVSAGDLLVRDASTSGVRVCARNRDLVGPFDVREDLGVDAVDVIDPDKRLIAFSTELDSPHGNFGHGDLLATNGAVIPAAVLLQNFQNQGLQPNVGLDGVHERVLDGIDPTTYRRACGAKQLFANFVAIVDKRTAAAARAGTAADD